GIEVEVFRAGTARLLARALEHGVECLGYRLQEDDGRRMLPDKLARAGVRGPAGRALQQAGGGGVGGRGARAGGGGGGGAAGAVGVEGRTVRLEEVSEPRPGQAFALVLDTRPCPAALALALGADLLVCEATYLDADREQADDHFHMTAAQAAELARAAGVRRL